MISDIIFPDKKDLNKSPVCKYYQVPLEDAANLFKSKLPEDFVTTFELHT